MIPPSSRFYPSQFYACFPLMPDIALYLLGKYNMWLIVCFYNKHALLMPLMNGSDFSFSFQVCEPELRCWIIFVVSDMNSLLFTLRASTRAVHYYFKCCFSWLHLDFDVRENTVCQSPLSLDYTDT